MDKIILNNLSIFGYHGVFPDEQKNGQNFVMDIEMFLDLKGAGVTDNLEETVDYGEVYKKIESITKNNKFRLVEKLAHSISQEILSSYARITEVMVRVKKPNAPINGKFEWVGVEIKRTRDDV